MSDNHPSVAKLTNPSQRGEATQLLCGELSPRAQDFQLHPAASQLWTVSLRFLASTPSRAAFNWKGTSEPAPARVRMPAPGWGTGPTQTMAIRPHTPGNNWGSLRLLISIGLKAGVPAKVPAATGHHNPALTKKRGHSYVTGRGDALRGGQ